MADFPENPWVKGFRLGLEAYDTLSGAEQKRADTQLRLEQAAAAKAQREAFARAKEPGTGAGAGTGGAGVESTREPSMKPAATPGSGTSSSGGGEGNYGSYGSQVVDYFKKAGYSDAMTQAIVAGGLGEGGFSVPWKKSDYVDPKTGRPEESYGHWQFHRGGELDGYEKWAAANKVQDLQNSLNQARYLDFRLTQIDPDLKNATDAKAATNRFMTDFLNPADKTPGKLFKYLPQAQQATTQWNAAQQASDYGSTAPAAPATAAAPTSGMPGYPGYTTGPGKTMRPIQRGQPGYPGDGSSPVVPPVSALPLEKPFRVADQASTPSFSQEAAPQGGQQPQQALFTNPLPAGVRPAAAQTPFSAPAAEPPMALAGMYQQPMPGYASHLQAYDPYAQMLAAQYGVLPGAGLYGRMA